jgi:hypothetical protein
MRHQDLRRPRGVESLWLLLKLGLVRSLAQRPCRGPDISHLSDHLLQDVGLERHADGLGQTSLRRRRC